MQRSLCQVRIVLAAAIWAACVGSASADVILGSIFGGGGSPAVADITTTTNKDLRWMGFGWTMSAGQDFTLDDIIINQISWNGPGTGAFFATLWSDSGGLPSTKLVNMTLTNGTGTVALANANFAPASTFNLTGGTSYWFILESPSNGKPTYRWLDGATGNDPAATSYASFIAVKQSLTAAAPGSPTAGTGGGADGGFQIDGTPTAAAPEPGSLALVGAVAIVLGLGAWRRRARPTIPDLGISA